MHNPESILENEMQHTNGSLNPGQSTRPCNSQQKKRTCRIVYFAILANHRVKLKENEKKDKYLWNMEVTIIPTISGVLGTVTKD